MGAYLCTYCHKNPGPRDRDRTREAAEQDHTLSHHLDGWDHSFYDWGDDPSFFAAQQLLRDVREATWGVCRPDVREALNEGDVVVFFCGCQRDDGGLWRYHFVGFGTVRQRVTDRACLWTNEEYERYRNFYNVLVRLEGEHLVHHEVIHPRHDNWEHRASAPYIVFDRACSFFNLTAPHHVATWEPGQPVPELWNIDDRSKELEQLLFCDRQIERRLRTAARRYPHPKLNLLTDEHRRPRPGRTLPELTQALSALVF